MMPHNTILPIALNPVVVPPQLKSGADVGLPGTIDLDMNDRIVRIDPDTQRNLGTGDACLDLDLSLAQLKRLFERQAFFERIRCDFDSHLTEFEKLACPAPGIGLAYIEKQVPALLDPDIQGNIAVAQRHGVGRTLARRIPYDVIVIH